MDEKETTDGDNSNGKKSKSKSNDTTTGVVRFMTSCISELGLPRMRMPGMRHRLDTAWQKHLMDEVESAWPDGNIPPLDPCYDLPLDRVAPQAELQLIRNKLESLDKRIKAHPWHHSKPDVKKRSMKQFKLYNQQEEQLKKQKEALEKKGSGKFKEELSCKTKVLRRLGYLDDNGQLTPKGVFGCSIESVDELVVTELVFEGIFQELSMCESVAFLAALLPHGKSTCRVRLTDKLKAVFDKLRAKAQQLSLVQQESRVVIDEAQYVNQFQSNAVMVVLAWVEGRSFRECTEMTDDFEGNIVRMLRRIEELLRQLIDAVKAIGNDDLVEKFTAGQAAITRGIAFAASLYIGEEEQRDDDDAADGEFDDDDDDDDDDNQ